MSDTQDTITKGLRRRWRGVGRSHGFRRGQVMETGRGERMQITPLYPDSQTSDRNALRDSRRDLAIPQFSGSGM